MVTFYIVQYNNIVINTSFLYFINIISLLNVKIYKNGLALVLYIVF